MILFQKVLTHFILPKIHLTEEEEFILYLMCPICSKSQGIVLKIHAGTRTRNLHVCFRGFFLIFLYLQLTWVHRKDLKRFLGSKWKKTVAREKWENKSIF